jgi:hypothetical protein
VEGKHSVSFNDWTKHTTVDLPIFVTGQQPTIPSFEHSHLSVNQTRILGLVLRNGTHIAFQVSLVLLLFYEVFSLIHFPYC